MPLPRNTYIRVAPRPLRACSDRERDVSCRPRPASPLRVRGARLVRATGTTFWATIRRGGTSSGGTLRTYLSNAPSSTLFPFSQQTPPSYWPIRQDLDELRC